MIETEIFYFMCSCLETTLLDNVPQKIHFLYCDAKHSITTLIDVFDQVIHTNFLCKFWMIDAYAY